MDAKLTGAEIPVPQFFNPSPYLSDEINRNIIQSEIEGGVYLRDLPCGAVLTIETQDWTCMLIYCDDGEALISGHPVFCPDPVRVHVSGSTWGGSMLKQAFIGRGMRLEMLHPRYGVLLTSPILDIHSHSLSHLIERALPNS